MNVVLRADELRADFARIRQEIAQNPFEVGFKTAGQNGEPVTFGGSRSGGAYIAPLNAQAAQPAAMIQPTALTTQIIRQHARQVDYALGGAGRADAASGILPPLVPGSRATSPNSVFSGGMTNWLSQATFTPRANGTTSARRAGFSSAREEAIRTLETMAFTAFDKKDLPELARVNDMLDRQHESPSVLPELVKDRQAARISGKIAREPAALTMADFNRGEASGRRPPAGDGYGAFRLAAGAYTALSVTQGALDASNAYRSDTMLAGTDSAAQLRAQIANRDRVASIVPVVGGLGASIREYFTREKADATFDLQQIGLREQTGASLQAARIGAQQATAGAQAAQIGLSGRYAGQMANINTREQADLTANAMDYLSRSEPFVARRQQLDTEAQRMRQSLVDRGGSFGQNDIFAGPASLFDDLKRYRELQKEAAGAAESLQKLKNASDKQAEAIGKTASVSRFEVSREAAFSLDDTRSRAASARLSGQGLDMAAANAVFNSRRRIAEDRLAAAQAGGDVTQIRLAEADLDLVKAEREQYVGRTNTAIRTQTQATDLRTRGAMFMRTGGTLAGELTNIDADRITALVGMSGGAEYLRNPNSTKINPDELAAIRAAEANFEEQRNAARNREERRRLSAAAYIDTSRFARSGATLEARVRQIEGEFATSTVDYAPGSADYKRERAVADERIAAARQESAFDTGQTFIGLRGQAMANVRLAGRDPVGARAFTTAAQSAMEIRNLLQNGPGSKEENEALAKLAQQNGLESLKIQRQDYLLGFRAQQFNPFEMTPFNPRDTQDPQSVQGAFGEASQQIKDATKGNGDAPTMKFPPDAMRELAREIGQEFESKLRNVVVNN
jgi:hypothetical protein